MIVADSGPIIVLARIGRLDLLRQVVGELMIPDAVYEELVGRGTERPGAAEVAHGDWIHRRTVQDLTTVAQLPRALHAGEREAIVLAQELGAQLLIDEHRGRTIAITRGVEVFGNLRVLAEAKRLGLIERAKPVVDAMRAAGYWSTRTCCPSSFERWVKTHHEHHHKERTDRFTFFMCLNTTPAPVLPNHPLFPAPMISLPPLRRTITELKDEEHGGDEGVITSLAGD